MLFRSRIQRALVQSRQRRGGGFGSPRDHEPAWIEKWNADKRQGKDSMDWFFHAFNQLGLYETVLKSSPRFYGFMVAGGIVGGYYWSRMWDKIWCYINKGLLYKDNPYVYPPEEEE
mmetsp:Transcript_80170/g.139156  ORF Transcript_80170/g.139156 Transcript_80170/m.139156 type:complete len:116 (+) Transcript_80170:72-419(+)